MLAHLKRGSTIFVWIVLHSCYWKKKKHFFLLICKRRRTNFTWRLVPAFVLINIICTLQQLVFIVFLFCCCLKKKKEHPFCCSLKKCFLFCCSFKRKNNPHLKVGCFQCCSWADLEMCKIAVGVVVWKKHFPFCCFLKNCCIFLLLFGSSVVLGPTLKSARLQLPTLSCSSCIYFKWGRRSKRKM